MCGITGFWGGSYEVSVAEKMSCAIASRGPDDSGAWVSKPNGLALAQRRLAILDLSSAGAQPMCSPCERYVLVFNGEIYNHKDIRRKLESEGPPFNWQGNSDTETLLAGLRHWGVQRCLPKLIGMFAFALWDNLEKTLVLARDRMGEKPLYYGSMGDTFLFGSELKALREHPAWQGEVDRDVLALFLRFSFVPTPWSIYHGIFKLPPAHYLTIADQGRSVGSPVCYWDLGKVAEDGVKHSIGSESQLADELDLLLRDAVKRQMAADVPLGAFLSGGYDSTTVAALMQAQSERPVSTFSIGFHERGFDEAVNAKSIARHLGTEHTEMYVTPQEAMAVIPKLPAIYDEPFADVSQIPTYLVSQLARRQVTVSLSGDGGDELFCGYNRYVSGYEVWNKLRGLPQPVRQMFAFLLNHTSGSKLDKWQELLPRQLQVSSLSDRVPKLADALLSQDGRSYYQALVSHTKNSDQLVLGAKEPKTWHGWKVQPDLPSLQEKMMLWDMMTYLPDDILTKVDRASMAVSLEARVPLLDHRVVEFAWKVPISLKYRDGQGKWLLRQVLYRYVPRSLMERPKMGFSVPIEQWLRGPLCDWANTLLDESRLRNESYLNSTLIRKMWQEHLSGKRNWHRILWNVLMFQAWLEQQVEA
jgi:asparagine synthase (glutamine-hydrolysing)